MWVSDVDATNELAGIHCGRIPDPLGHAAVAIARRLLRVVP